MARARFSYNKRFGLYEIITKPVAGKFYLVPKDSWLDTISMATYGTVDYVTDIIEANDFLADKPIFTPDGLPFINTGDILWLPDILGKKNPDKIPFTYEDEITIRIDGKIFRGWESATINRNLNTCADVFSFVAQYNPDSESAKYLEPYRYYDADLFIGGELYIAGRIMKNTPAPNVSGTFMTVEARSLPGVTVDCQSLDKSLNYNRQTLKQIAKKILMPFGVKTDFPDGDTDPFIKVNREVEETVFDFLSKLAQQKGFVITSTLDSKMSFVRADILSEPVANLVSGKQPLLNVSASYDSTKRFSHYTAYSQSSSRAGNKAQIVDESIIKYRPMTFIADSTEAGNILDAVKWKRSRMLAESAPVSANVTGWRDFKKNLWMENKTVTLYFPKACIFRETKFLITAVSLQKDLAGGNITTLTLSLPEAFTLDFPEEFPWLRY